jgi:transposase
MAPRFSNEVSMPTERLSMRKIRDVLRMKFDKGLSERAIARSLSLSAGAVNGYLQRVRAGLSWPMPDGLDDTTLERLLFPPAPPAAAAGRPVPDWTAVEKELRRRGVTLALLWEEYRAAHSDGFGYSWFCEQYAALKRRMRPTMRQTHVAGEKVFVDFAGDTIDIVDPATGEVLPMKLFVAVMGASNYIFAQARASEKIADWIGAHVDLFAFLGGVPKFVVCDNLKAAVTNPDRYEPGLNRSYLELADHYGAVILPARPYKPRDKAKVEQSVLLAERWILAKLRNHRFFGAADLNAAISDLVRDINARLMKGFDASRAELFAAIDRPALKDLPDEPYAFAVWKRCRVAPDYHVDWTAVVPSVSTWLSAPMTAHPQLTLRIGPQPGSSAANALPQPISAVHGTVKSLCAQADNITIAPAPSVRAAILRLPPKNSWSHQRRLCGVVGHDLRGRSYCPTPRRSRW